MLAGVNALRGNSRYQETPTKSERSGRSSVSGRGWPRGSVGDAPTQTPAQGHRLCRCNPSGEGLAGRGGASGGRGEIGKVSARL